MSLEIAITILCLGFLFICSAIEAAITQSSPLVLRMMTEHPEKPVSDLLNLVLEDKMQILVPLNLGNQLSVIIIAVLITHMMLRSWPEHGLIYSFIAVVLISIVFRQLLPRLLTQNDPETKLIPLLQAFGSFYPALHSLALPISRTLKACRKMKEDITESSKPENEETTGEEIQAYLEIGEDEGILQKEDSQLIQSVVEFGDTLVREVMTPRTRIVACEERATISELRETMVQHRHSRIPIYRGDIDHIVGIAYIRQLLAEYPKGRESESISGLVNPVLFVPGTKRVSKLLKELQQRGDHIAIVIDEFGGVAGLVSIEDLVEEIIGEIHDEDEAKVKKVIEEGPRTFVIRGSTELSRLEELANRRFDNLNCSTVAGLVVSYLGRVPAQGETFELYGMKVQVMDADRKRVHWIRIQLPEAG
jgi:putative hemolysin